MTMLKFLPLETGKIHKRQTLNVIENNGGHFYHPLPPFRLPFFGANIIKDGMRRRLGLSGSLFGRRENGELV